MAMWKSTTVGLILILSIISGSLADSGNFTAEPENEICYESQADFETKCVEQLNGTRHGGQCYFVVNASYPFNWEGAWDLCEERGAVLAQIHSDAELKAIGEHLQRFYTARFGNSGENTMHRLALASSEARPSLNATTIQPKTTFWYQDRYIVPNTSVAEVKLLIPAGETWIRTHASDGDSVTKLVEAPRCFQLTNNFKLIVDRTCASETTVLCQLTNRNQNFTRTDSCITENPIQEFSVPTPRDCAAVCSSTPWCRSFNIRTPDAGEETCSTRCQLFTWSVNDDPACTKCAQRVQGNATCFHYNYVA